MDLNEDALYLRTGGGVGALSLLTSVTVSKDEDQAKFVATDLKPKKVRK